MTRIAVLQMTSGIDPEANCAAITDALSKAAQGRAAMLFTPEMCSLLDRDRARAAPHIVDEVENETLSAIQMACQQNDIWAVLGSIPVSRDSGKSANRSIVIDNEGVIRARYDKMHMFDVDLDTGESWRESNAYQAGDAVVAVETPIGRLGLTICYDIRFPALYQELGKQYCDAIAIPAAFTVPTGKDHWRVLQRARAIEASAYVVAAAQVGEHEDGRTTYGHSLVVDPWGKVILDMGDDTGLGFADIDPARIAEVRAQLPSLANRRDIPKSPQS
ncbi:carbon-nitrogen hydrolase family protein [Pontixanthobacter aestiaquae]|uniref:Carbon-nitrogen hydrolase family protein n=1 Tax=Pontixanthobacter aestiaquae TaxID=1509367 RepID=A0A844Z9G7_9SPHN|nr:carbon-nitrogen hydrolase family protein [Pontixanthobacter aestiaquae]MDN3645356.1 carbon-nitrogen hydrolase family protein [Pontixanthobacter aestiaquae]MXO83643.1 carbon-nitrogen hydrolase family protein [Pontixanthobacter aestiaquae]